MKKSKICTKCKKIKYLKDFGSHKRTKDELKTRCKQCLVEDAKEYRETNRKAINNRARKKRMENPRHYREIVYRYRKKYPWAYTYASIGQRCNNPNVRKYEYYGGRGIKRLITIEELKKLWFRDKAYLMEQPSIDRIDSDGHYELQNCRYIEMDKNRKTIKRKKHGG